MLVRCYWCISILIIIPTIKCCSLTGPLCGWSAVVLLIVGIQASGISIPLSLLMLLGWSLITSSVIANLYTEEFEEQAIATATYKPKIWKRYVDDTFTILGKDYVDSFKGFKRSSHHPCLQKATHTDQYLGYGSHHPQSVKRAIVKCLRDRAKHLTSKPSAISEEKKHLSSVLVSNRYPSSFVRKLTKTTRPTANKKNLSRNLNLLRFYPT